MFFAKTDVVVQHQFFTRADGAQGFKLAVFLIGHAGFFRVVQVNSHVHRIHAHTGDVHDFIGVVAKNIKLLPYAPGQSFQIMVGEFNFFNVMPCAHGVDTFGNGPKRKNANTVHLGNS